jgi:hypothetical protein
MPQLRASDLNHLSISSTGWRRVILDLSQGKTTQENGSLQSCSLRTLHSKPTSDRLEHHQAHPVYSNLEAISVKYLMDLVGLRRRPRISIYSGLFQLLRILDHTAILLKQDHHTHPSSLPDIHSCLPAKGSKCFNLTQSECLPTRQHHTYNVAW